MCACVCVCACAIECIHKNSRICQHIIIFAVYISVVDIVYLMSPKIDYVWKSHKFTANQKFRMIYFHRQNCVDLLLVFCVFIFLYLIIFNARVMAHRYISFSRESIKLNHKKSVAKWISIHWKANKIWIWLETHPVDLSDFAYRHQSIMASVSELPSVWSSDISI